MNLEDARRRCARAGAFVCAVCCAALLAGCAPDVQRRPSVLVPTAQLPAPEVTVVQDVRLNPGAAYARVVRAGTTWKLIGRAEGGDVYRPVNTIFTVESAHVHEAALVISEGKVIGFYMLVEQAFVPLETAVPIQLVQGGK